MYKTVQSVKNAKIVLAKLSKVFIVSKKVKSVKSLGGYGKCVKLDLPKIAACVSVRVVSSSYSCQSNKESSKFF